jgi:hypothetical protein
MACLHVKTESKGVLTGGGLIQVPWSSSKKPLPGSGLNSILECMAAPWRQRATRVFLHAKHPWALVVFFAQINICAGRREIKARVKAIQPDEKK